MLTAPFDAITAEAFLLSVVSTLRAGGSSPKYVLLIGGGCGAPLVPTTRMLLTEDIPRWAFGGAQARGEAPPEDDAYAKFVRSFWETVRRESGAALALDDAGRPVLNSAAAQHAALAAVFHPRSVSGLGGANRRRAFTAALTQRADGALAEAHVFLASLLLEQERWGIGAPLARTVFTTAFDTLLQSALQAVQRHCTVLDRPEALEPPQDEDPAFVRLIYTHGAAERYRPPGAGTDSDSAATAALTHYLEQRGVIALGYSGWPDALLEALRRCERFEHGLFWCGRNTPETAAQRMRPECVELLTQHRGAARYVQVESAGVLLRQMHVAFGLGAAPEFIRQPLRPVIDKFQALRIVGEDAPHDGARAGLQPLVGGALVRLQALSDEFERGTRGEFSPGNGSPFGSAAERAALVASATQHAILGDFAAAVECWGRLLGRADLTPLERWDALCRRGHALATLGEAHAEPDWDEVIASRDAPPDRRAWALRQRAEWRAAHERETEAIADWTALLALDASISEQLSAWLRRGILHQRRGDTAAAVADLSEVIARDSATLLGRAEALFARGAAYQSALDYTSACCDYTELLELEDVPAEARVYAIANRAAARLEMENFAGAAADATEVLDLAGLPTEVRLESTTTRARAHAALEEHDQALRDYSAVLDHPQCPADLRAELMRGRAQSYQTLGRLDAALADYEVLGDDTRELAQARAEALLTRANLRRRNGEERAALQDFAEVLQTAALSPEMRATVLRERGVALLELGDAEGALCDFCALIENTEAPAATRAFALNQRGIMSRKRNDLDAAIADYTAALALAGAPTEQRTWALNNRGVAHRKKGNLAAAVADYTAVLETPDAPGDQVIKALNNRGVAHGVLGQSDRALADYTAVIARSEAPPDQRARALQNRAIIYGIRGDTDQAIADYSAVLALGELSPEFRAKALNNRAAVRASQGNLQGALADYSAVLALDETPLEQRVAALNGRGYVHNLRGATAREIDDYSAVIDLPQAAAEQKAWALNNRGAARAGSGDLAGAIADHTAVLGLSGVSAHQRAWALNNRAFAHRRNNDADAELADSDAVLALEDAPCEQRGWALANRGWLHLQQQRVDEAVQLFRSATEADAASAAHRFNLGLALLVQGAAGMAAAEFDAGIQLNPSSEQLDDVLRDLGFVQRTYGNLDGIEHLRAMLR